MCSATVRVLAPGELLTGVAPLVVCSVP